MQDLLTTAFNFVAIASIAYVLLALTGFIMSRRRAVLPGQLELPLFEPETAPVNLDDSFDDLLNIGGDRASITLRDCTIRQLKALASLYQVPRFNKLRKDELNPVVMSAIAA
ncbi:MAG: hypothetical protein WBA57_27535 [Elainellaceae cyanobacterium]